MKDGPKTHFTFLIISKTRVSKVEGSVDKNLLRNVQNKEDLKLYKFVYSSCPRKQSDNLLTLKMSGLDTVCKSHRTLDLYKRFLRS